MSFLSHDDDEYIDPEVKNKRTRERLFYKKVDLNDIVKIDVNLVNKTINKSRQKHICNVTQKDGTSHNIALDDDDLYHVLKRLNGDTSYFMK